MARRTPGLTKRGNVWWVHKSIQGTLIRESTGTSSLAEAERYLALRIEQVRRQTVYGERPAVTFTQAFEKYLAEACPTKSIPRAGEAAERFLPWIGDTDVTLIHDGSLNGYREERREAGVAAGTINKELQYIVRVLNLCARVWRHDNGRPYVDTAPLLRREKGKARPPMVLTWDTQKALLPQLPVTQAAMTLFALNTGLRQEEFCSLRWDWRVDVPELGTYVFILPDAVTKTAQERVVVLNSIARRVVEARPQLGDYVFVNKFGNRYHRLYNHTWQTARERAGVPTLRVHDLRHTFGHRLRAAGVDIEDRADLLGHSSGRMTTHYSAPELGRLLDAAESIVTERPATVLTAVGGR